MAIFVLVHGTGHGGWCWQKVAHKLRFADKARNAGWQIRDIETGHDAMLTVPDEVDSHLLELAGVN